MRTALASSPPAGWSTAQRWLHWAVAFGVLFDFSVAWVMTRLGEGHGLLTFVLYQLHKNVGVFVLAAVVARLVLLAWRGRPALPADLSETNQRLALLGHAVLYALLLLVPSLGYLTNSTAPARIPVLLLLAFPLPNLTPASEAWFDVLVQLHRGAAVALVATALAHATIAVIHHRHGSPILRRMWRG